jgi:uncharacterized delta-60 repeat protein
VKGNQQNVKKTSKTPSVVLAAALLALGAPLACAQSPSDGFAPNANGAIRAVVVQPDGKTLIGGDFTTLSSANGDPFVRNHIARLNPDGTVDAAFDPNANGAVYAIALQTDGKILVGGTFNGANSIGGQARNFIARLDAITGAPDSFNPGANSGVRAILVQADGKILVGGGFTSVGGKTRSRIARLDPANGLADSFNPNASDTVYSIVVQANGMILVGGAFSGPNSVGGQTRNHMARLDPASGLTDSFNPNANGDVLAIAVEADGQILAGGTFTGANGIGGQPRNHIARLDSASGLADSFDPNANGDVDAIVVQPDGKIVAGGAFNGANSIGGEARSRIARLDPISGLADSFDPSANGAVLAIALGLDGKILAGGNFAGVNSIGGQMRNYIARLEIDGTVDQAFDANILGNADVRAIAVQPDGKILVGGIFTNVNNVDRHYIARLNLDGTIDGSFDPHASDDVRAIAVEPDGRIVIAGNFTTLSPNGGDAITRQYIARLNPDGTVDPDFNPGANAGVFSLAIQTDGQVLAGGLFSPAYGTPTIGGETRNYFARLDATTGAADSLDPSPDYYVLSIAVQRDGKIVAGGGFDNIGGQSRSGIARLDPITGAADSFAPNANSFVSALLVQPDGQILASGSFNGENSIGGQTRNFMARLDPATGAADALFDPNANDVITGIALQSDNKVLAGGAFNGTNSIGGQTRNRVARLDPVTGAADSFNPDLDHAVNGVLVMPDGKILVAGVFSAVGGAGRASLARLSNDTAAIQNLAVTQSSVTWTRGGAAPALNRVTFEISTDEVNYTPLGDGTPTGSNWILTGLNFPSGQNLYIRARGYYSGGLRNASRSITESVRNLFISPPTPTSVVSRKTHGTRGDFGIDLLLGDNLGVECRTGQGPSSDQHQIIFTFAVPITLSGSPTVSVSAPAGGTPGATASVSDSVVTVDLTGILNAQTLTITLTNVNDSGPVSVQMGVLLGDVNGDGFVLSGDYTAVRQRSGATVDETNFHYDINTDGFILSGDYTTARQQSGSHLSANPEFSVELRRKN